MEGDKKKVSVRWERASGRVGLERKLHVRENLAPCLVPDKPSQVPIRTPPSRRLNYFIGLTDRPHSMIGYSFYFIHPLVSFSLLQQGSCEFPLSP
jgi:hypothetical protein